MQHLKLNRYTIVVDDQDIKVIQQILKEMSGTLSTLPIENMTIQNIFQQIVNQHERLERDS
tara:strand:+ start:39178 stop:39360 length:183 start_codon:yes stop_codon:yes gene_type:complete